MLDPIAFELCSKKFGRLLRTMVTTALVVGVLIGTHGRSFGHARGAALRPSQVKLSVAMRRYGALVAAEQFSLFLVRRYVFEAFRMPINAMAPTICGTRLEGKCSKCGGTAISQQPEGPGEGPYPAQCLSCRNYFTGNQFKGEPKPADLFLVVKSVVPVRGNIVAFRPPSQPDELHVKRIVGLPGEEIVIRDGAVYADGVRVESALSGLRYTARPGEHNPVFRFHDFDREPLLGDPRRPVKLGDDEYFLLGDHTDQSLDSRMFGSVQLNDMAGTVFCVYWPIERLKVFW